MSVTTTVAQSALSREERQSTSLVGITTAGTRALASQFFTFYLRIPVKLFRPTRIDYMALPRAINPTYHSKPWNFFTHSSPALIAHAVREHGWGFIPHNILPPLIANSAVGVALYTSYLSSLAILRDDNGHYGLRQTLISGAVAGAVQSLAAAPIDAIVTRFNVSEMIQSDHKALWQYGWTKLKEIGPHGVFSGFAVSLLKESLSFALYFATFEEIKGSCPLPPGQDTEAASHPAGGPRPVQQTQPQAVVAPLLPGLPENPPPDEQAAGARRPGQLVQMALWRLLPLNVDGHPQHKHRPHRL
ncbi:hypothetical protein TRICI_000727 [Trichomonascus ciferrii]|uniref:Mitochondrial carrier n=1 Tax=Trichomonascus ciferrii TaxID=44093 RepID=A0A642VB90_9ASCO|nr:hypothetical protein TRICI_000727 [Trichomonascus ciferrii]